MRRALVALLLGALVLVAPASAAAAAPAPAKKRVCVTKVVKKATKKRKAVKKRVCRVKKTTRKTAKRSPVVAAPRPWFPPAPAAPASTTPPPGAATAPVAPTAPTAQVPLPPAPVVPVCEDDSPWLGAIADEDGAALFRLDLTRDCVRAGRVLVRYVNSDETPHNLYARGIAPPAPAQPVVGAVPPKSLDTEDPAGQRDGAVQLTAGTWRLYCAIPGHEVMTRDLQVTPAS